MSDNDSQTSKPNRKTGGKTRRARVCAIGNQKGGVCKSTHCAHIAAALGEMGHLCLIWDLDENFGATVGFGIPEVHSYPGTFEILAGYERARSVILRDGDSDVELPKNVDLITSKRKLGMLEQVLASKNESRFGGEVVKDFGDLLREPLNKDLRPKYDYIFLDTAPAATIPTVAAYETADYFLLAAMPEPYAIQGLDRALSDIQSTQSSKNANLKLVGVVLGNVPTRRSRLRDELLDYVEKTFSAGGEMTSKYQTNVGDTIAIPRAQKRGKTIFQTEPKHKVADEYRAIAKELHERITRYESSEEDESVLDDQKKPEVVVTANADAIKETVHG